MYVCIYSREVGLLAPAPRPSLIYCASPFYLTLYESRTLSEQQGLAYGGVIIVTWFHEELAQVTKP
jgi:hypothetical protein